MAIKDTSLGTLYAKSLATGIGALANHKLSEIKTKKLVDMFEKNKFDPQTSQFLAWAAENNPQHFHNILEMIGSGQGGTQTQGMQQGEGMPTEASGTQTGGIAEALRNRAQQKQISPAQETQLKKDRDTNLSLYRIASGLEESLNEGVELGIFPTILSNISGTQLAEQYGEPTARFSQLSNDFILAKGEAMKGPLTRGKQSLLEKAKVGLDKSESVNRRYIKDLKDDAIRSYKEIVRKDPSLAIPEIDAEINEELKKSLPPLTPSKAKKILETEFKMLPASQQDEGDIAESDEGYTFIVKNGKWAPYQGK